jgi:hypothetical protein
METGPRRQVTFGAIPQACGHRIGLYGQGGIGKTTLAAEMPGPVAFFDLDESLGQLKPDGDIRLVDGISTWADLRATLQADGWDGIKSIVIDTATKAEELAIAHTLATVRHEKGQAVSSIEDYGFGKGYQHVYETFIGLLGDLDRHARAGRNVCLVCHDCTCNVPNPSGEDFLRFEPRLQSPNSGKASIRLRVREWLDHLFFLDLDRSVSKDGKARGSGSRTLYPSEMGWCSAKSRTVQQPMPLVSGYEVWQLILGGK